MSNHYFSLKVSSWLNVTRKIFVSVLVCICIYLLFLLARLFFPYELSFPKPEIHVSISESSHFTREQINALPEIRDPYHSGFQPQDFEVDISFSASIAQSDIAYYRRTAQIEHIDENTYQLAKAANQYGDKNIAAISIFERYSPSPSTGISSSSRKRYYALVSQGKNKTWKYIYTENGAI
ncbi:hypothetical protein EJ419_01235 [Alloscardovia theropitheci]|uniref:Uncharacterized protein n=1 Tax=Alloscardovia theropitheci TaxID=2496842 RepID=A0A4R0R0Y4_9BIFI|nr:hypothetical protein [Alloscardovia theropitheci]TCD54756.1 hypothetical protein EJ419_01235 [Alloscardovia theropitheci]